MLLVLDHSVANADFSDINYMNSLENILCSVFEGRHSVYAERGCISDLLKVQGLSVRSKLILRKMDNEFAQLGSIFNLYSYKIVISLIDEIEKNNLEWNVPLILFSSSSMSNDTILLCENITDCRAYIHAAKQFMAIRKIKGFRLSVDPRGGGGSSIAEEYNNILTTNVGFSICVKDSDKDSPFCSNSRNAIRCKEIESNSNCITKCIVLIEREIENIIPHTIFNDILTQEKLESWEKCRNAIPIISEDFLNYLDIKKGLDLKYILNVIINTDSKNYWLSNIKKLHEASRLNLDCWPNEGENCDSESCDCKIFGPLGVGLLNLVVEYFGSRSIQKSLEKIKVEDFCTWFEMGELVFNWASAPEPVRC